MREHRLYYEKSFILIIIIYTDNNKYNDNFTVFYCTASCGNVKRCVTV